MSNVLLIYAENVGINLGRYILACGIVALMTLIPAIRRSPLQKQVSLSLSRKSLRHELVSSFVTIMVVAAFGLLMLYCYKAGYSQVSKDDKLLMIPAVLVGVAVLLLMFDLYFYAFHRLLHVFGIARTTHDVHHIARPTTAWGALAFSPFEAAIIGMFFLLATLLVPMHPVTMQIFMFIVFFQSAVHHSGYRFYPVSWPHFPILGLWATANHHQLHHRSGRYNFGLYFVWWDRLLKTEHPNYKARDLSENSRLRNVEQS
jgi:lathosterol oxidase